jgi:putative endonuclease
MQKEMQMARHNRSLGQWGEEKALDYLQGQSCQSIARNWRCAAGEVDLVVREGEWLAFVEVRTRRSRAFGTAEESISAEKLGRMAAVAEAYVYEHEWKGPWRLDVIAIESLPGSTPRIEWYRNVSS